MKFCFAAFLPCFCQACVLLDTFVCFCVFSFFSPFFFYSCGPFCSQCAMWIKAVTVLYVYKNQGARVSVTHRWDSGWRQLTAFAPPPSKKIQYKEDLGAGTALPDPPEMDRVKRNQRNVSMVLARQSDPALHLIPRHSSSLHLSPL